MSLHFSSDMVCKPQWDPSDILDLNPDSSHFICVGKAKTGSRCRWSINEPERKDASRKLRDLSLYTPTSSAVRNKLRDLAALLLCQEWHQYQVYEVASAWSAKIQEVTVEITELQNLRIEVDYLKKIIKAQDDREAKSRASKAERAELDAELLKLRNELSAVREDNTKWKGSSKDQEKQVEELLFQLIDLQSQSAKAQSDLRRSEHSCTALNADKNRLLLQNVELETELASARQKTSSSWWEAANKQLCSERREKEDRAKIAQLVQQVDNIRPRLVKGHLIAFCSEARLRAALTRLTDAKQLISKLNHRIVSAKERQQTMQSELENARTEHAENTAQLGDLQNKLDGSQAEMADISFKATQREAEMGAASASDKATIRQLRQQVEELKERRSTSRWKTFFRRVNQRDK